MGEITVVIVRENVKEMNVLPRIIFLLQAKPILFHLSNGRKIYLGLYGKENVENMRLFMPAGNHACWKFKKARKCWVQVHTVI